MGKLSWILERERRQAAHAVAMSIAQGLDRALPARDVYVYFWHGTATDEHKKLIRRRWSADQRSQDTFPGEILDVVSVGGLLLVSDSLEQDAPLRAWIYEPERGVWPLSAEQAEHTVQLSPDYLDAFEIEGVPSWSPE